MRATEAFEAILAFGEHEHRDLARGLDRIHLAGCGVSATARLATARAIHEVLAWSTESLEPHIAWEESWLYPQIDALTGTPWATRAARFDHGQIHAVAARLEHDERAMMQSITPAAADDVRAHLFGFEALLRAHMDREEQLLLPVLAGAGLDA